MVEPVLFAGCAGSLAWEASDDSGDWWDASSNCPDIVIDGKPWPAFAEDAAAPWIDFAEPCMLDACEFESVVEHPDA